MLKCSAARATRESSVEVAMQSPGTASNQDDADSREITLEALLHATKLSVGKNEHLAHYLKRITHLALNGDVSKARTKGGNGTGAIRKIQNLHHCPNLKVLYLYDNEVEAMENLEVVPQLTHLHLQGNCLRRIENLETLGMLEKLYLEKNAIARLEGLAGCFRLHELYLANQRVPLDLHFSFEEDSMRALAVNSHCRLLCVCALSNDLRALLSIWRSLLCESWTFPIVAWPPLRRLPCCAA
ncbi:unnamed protein product [Phytophthora lilii]|uniref:Unnamed protein product n=1 Tax=Phytophthora lilii TaxID=2077276 RepID=A0A9W6WTZ7_9STRA|nr:unnamed protein product [Phytophthora lilii]